ncbi:hypothetical protein D9757_008704 [Collybiopsis confluens]|uniref:Protein kinase domain-containing protein n=1 Tax=Collybiopsis confluens TaxID=2823264 RepID=A0A8H5M301_9AGAR|nr:hypothetical protein D9757_008704 [Collybiopsis confluens]
MSYFTKDLLVLVLTLILAVHAAPYSAVKHRHVGMIGNAVRSNNNQVQAFNTSIQNESGRLGRRANPDPPKWLLSRFDDSKMLTDTDTKVFNSELKDLELGLEMKFTAPTKNNGGIWNVKSYKGVARRVLLASDRPFRLVYKPKPVSACIVDRRSEAKRTRRATKGYSGLPGDLLLKVVRPNNSGYGEVKALKQVGDFVASGYIKDPGLSTEMKSKSDRVCAVTIMKKKDGKTLEDLHLPTVAQTLVVAKVAKVAACNAAAEIAVNKEVLHGDLNVGNILIKMAQQPGQTSVNLVDWGSGNWVSKGVKKEDVVRLSTSLDI